MNKVYTKHIVAGLVLLLLVAVRLLERRFFDDGLIVFFEHDYLKDALPSLSITRTLLTDSIRFWLNALLSIFILYLYFKQKGLLKFLLIFYAVAYGAGIVSMYFALQNYHTGHYLLLFYVRRFLIQPLLLFLLLPALWYQKHQKT